MWFGRLKIAWRHTIPTPSSWCIPSPTETASNSLKKSSSIYGRNRALKRKWLSLSAIKSTWLAPETSNVKVISMINRLVSSLTHLRSHMDLFEIVGNQFWIQSLSIFRCIYHRALSWKWGSSFKLLGSMFLVFQIHDHDWISNGSFQ